jgi:hypothetical protein
MDLVSINNPQHVNSYPFFLLFTLPSCHLFPLLTNRNFYFRQLVHTNKVLYLTSSRERKAHISQSIVATIRSQSPQGRFLERNPLTGLWYDIGDRRAGEKTSQALREGAPRFRQSMLAKTKSKSTSTTKEDQEDAHDNNENANSAQQPTMALGKGKRKSHGNSHSSSDASDNDNDDANSCRKKPSASASSASELQQAMMGESLGSSSSLMKEVDGYDSSANDASVAKQAKQSSSKGKGKGLFVVASSPSCPSFGMISEQQEQAQQQEEEDKDNMMTPIAISVPSRARTASAGPQQPQHETANANANSTKPEGAAAFQTSRASSEALQVMARSASSNGSMKSSAAASVVTSAGNHSRSNRNKKFHHLLNAASHTIRNLGGGGVTDYAQMPQQDLVQRLLGVERENASLKFQLQAIDTDGFSRRPKHRSNVNVNVNHVNVNLHYRSPNAVAAAANDHALVLRMQQQQQQMRMQEVEAGNYLEPTPIGQIVVQEEDQQHDPQTTQTQPASPVASQPEVQKPPSPFAEDAQTRRMQLLIRRARAGSLADRELSSEGSDNENNSNSKQKQVSYVNKAA